MICDRCHTDTLSHTVSRFNTEDLCLRCSQDEREAPNYARAHAAEEAACRAGDYNYPGIGLGADDHLFLQTRRLARAAAARSHV